MGPSGRSGLEPQPHWVQELMLTALGVQVLLQRARAVTSPGGPVVHQVVILYFFNEKPYLAKKTSEDDSALGVYSPEIPPRTDFFLSPSSLSEAKPFFSFLTHTPVPLMLSQPPAPHSTRSGIAHVMVGSSEEC